MNKVYIVSGGLFNELSSIFSGYNLSLFAENGFLYRSDLL